MLPYTGGYPADEETIQVEAGIAPQEVTLTDHGDQYVLALATGERMVIYSTEHFRRKFADGTVGATKPLPGVGGSAGRVGQSQ